MVVGFLLAGMLGLVDLVLRGQDSVLRTIWEGFAPGPATPIERALERLPQR